MLNLRKYIIKRIILKLDRLIITQQELIKMLAKRLSLNDIEMTNKLIRDKVQNKSQLNTLMELAYNHIKK